MKKLNHFNSNNLLSAFLVLCFRAGKFLANVSPLGSFGFFANSPAAFALSVIAFDVLVGGFYRGFLWTYAGFAFYPLLGLVARGNTRRQVLLLPVASFLFFLVSNFGVWWHWYDHTMQGLITCYILAVPFYARTLLGDLGFGYGYLVIKKLIQLRPQVHLSRYFAGVGSV